MSAPVQLALFGPQRVHLFRWDAAAVAVPSRGSKAGGKYRLGASVCVMCAALESFVTDWADCSSCPGRVDPAPPWSVLGADGEAAETLPLAASVEAA